MTTTYSDIALQIAWVPGLHWKIWLENSADGASGGIYLFEDEASATVYLEMILPRLHAFGFQNITAKMFDVNEPLTEMTHGRFRR